MTFAVDDLALVGTADVQWYENMYGREVGSLRSDAVTTGPSSRTWTATVRRGEGILIQALLVSAADSGPPPADPAQAAIPQPTFTCTISLGSRVLASVVQQQPRGKKIANCRAPSVP